MSPNQISWFRVKAFKTNASFKHSDDDDDDNDDDDNDDDDDAHVSLGSVLRCVKECFLFISLQIRTFEQPDSY